MNDILTTIVALISAVISGYVLLRKSSSEHENSDIADMRKIIQTWQDSYGALVARMDILQAKTNAIIDENARLIRQIAILENESTIAIENIRREVESEIAQRRAQSTEIITLGEKLRIAEETIAGQAMVIAELRRDLTHSETQRKDLKRLLGEAESKIAVLEAQVAVLTGK